MREVFEPLENAIRDQLIPALVGREVSEAERQIVALPLRHGGLGLTDPRDTAKTEYKHSTQITDNLLLRSEIPSGMCAKLRTVAASNNRDHARNLSYYCLLALHV